MPDNATLKVIVWDKDEGYLTDDVIGQFETSINPGPKEVEIVGRVLGLVKGTFWLNVSC